MKENNNQEKPIKKQFNQVKPTSKGSDKPLKDKEEKPYKKIEKGYIWEIPQ